VGDLAALAAAVDIAEAALRTALAASVVSLVFCSSAQSQPRLLGSVLGSGEFGLPLFEKSSLEAGTGAVTGAYFGVYVHLASDGPLIASDCTSSYLSAPVIRYVDLEGRLRVTTLKLDLRWWPTFSLERVGLDWVRYDL
jgi:hypothetical protein